MASYEYKHTAEGLAVRKYTETVKPGVAWVTQNVTVGATPDLTKAFEDYKKFKAAVDAGLSVTDVALTAVEKLSAIYVDPTSAAIKAILQLLSDYLESFDNIGGWYTLADVPYGWATLGPKASLEADLANDTLRKSKQLLGYYGPYETEVVVPPHRFAGGGSGLAQVLINSLDHEDAPLINDATATAGLHIVFSTSALDKGIAAYNALQELVALFSEAKRTDESKPQLPETMHPQRVRVRYIDKTKVRVRFTVPNLDYPRTEEVVYRGTKVTAYYRRPVRYQVWACEDPAQYYTLDFAKSESELNAVGWTRIRDAAIPTSDNRVDTAVLAPASGSGCYVVRLLYHVTASRGNYGAVYDGKRVVMAGGSPSINAAVFEAAICSGVSPPIVYAHRAPKTRQPGGVPQWEGGNPMDGLTAPIRETLADAIESAHDTTRGVDESLTASVRTGRSWVAVFRRWENTIDRAIEALAALGSISGSYQVRAFQNFWVPQSNPASVAGEEIPAKYLSAGQGTVGKAGLIKEYQDALTDPAISQGPNDYAVGLFVVLTGPATNTGPLLKAVSLLASMFGASLSNKAGVEASWDTVTEGARTQWNAFAESIHSSTDGSTGPLEQAAPPSNQATQPDVGTAGQPLVGSEDSPNRDLNCPPEPDLSTLDFNDNFTVVKRT